MSKQGKSLKNKAHKAIFDALAKSGQDFPLNLQLRRGRTRSTGTEYTGSLVFESATFKVVKVLYHEGNNQVTEIEDLRTVETLTAIQELQINPLDKARREMIPQLIQSLKYRLGGDFIGWIAADEKIELSVIGRLVVRDKFGLRRVVHCIPIDQTDAEKQIRSSVREIHSELIDYVCVVVWSENTLPQKVAVRIASQIKEFRKNRWRQPR